MPPRIPDSPISSPAAWLGIEQSNPSYWTVPVCRCGARIAGAKILAMQHFANNAGGNLSYVVLLAEQPLALARVFAESAERA